MAESNLTVRIITPETEIFSGEAEAVFLPGSLGPFEVLRNHAPIISTLEKGEVRVRDLQGNESSVAVRSGAVRVKDNIVTICAEV